MGSSRLLMLMGALAGVVIALGLWFGLRAAQPAPALEAAGEVIDLDAPEPAPAPPKVAQREKADAGAVAAAGASPAARPAVPPAAPEPRFSLEAAPGKFMLGEHHRFLVDLYPKLPDYSLGIDIAPGLTVERLARGGAAGARGPSEKVGLLLFTRTAAGLSSRTVGASFSWEGGEGWLIGLRSAMLDDRVLTTPMAWSKRGKSQAPIEASVATVESTSQFRVRSLPGANSWTLTVTAKGGEGQAVVSPVMQALPNPELTADAWLDGRPLDGSMAVLKPGTHTLYGARELWLTVPAVSDVKTAPLEVELTPLPPEADLAMARRPLPGERKTFTPKKGLAGAGELRCDRITSVGPLAGVVDQNLAAFRIELGAEPPVLMVESALPRPKRSALSESQQGNFMMENLRAVVEECRRNEKTLEVGRSKRVDWLKTTRGVWSGLRVDAADLVYRRRP